MSDPEVQTTLDARGLFCPEPVMMLHNKVRDLSPGGLLKVIATDPSTRRDIPKFCVFLGHELLGQAEEAFDKAMASVQGLMGGMMLPG